MPHDDAIGQDGNGPQVTPLAERGPPWGRGSGGVVPQGFGDPVGGGPGGLLHRLIG
jgi:hypothetical protein